MFRILAIIAMLAFHITAKDLIELEPKQILEVMLENKKFTSTINFCRTDSSQLILTDTSGYLLDYHGKKICGKGLIIESDHSYDFDVNRKRLPTDSNRFLFILKNQVDTIYFEVYEPWGNGLVSGYYLPEKNKVDVTGRGNF